MSAPLILMVEDDATLGTSLQQRLELEGFRVRWARSAREARAALPGAHPAIILSDIRLPDGDGEAVMRSHFANFGLVPTIFMTAYGDIEQAVRLVRDGALDYVTKPFDLDQLVDRFRDIVRRATPQAIGAGTPLGRSAAMQPVVETLSRAARVALPVLLLGETGSGKEVAARHVHDSGPRSSAPFVPVNCGAMPAELADSMLFGHERGAFTGAAGTHRGLLEEAGEGTLFLDEIGDLPLPLQVKLLRVLETRAFRRLGAAEERGFHARLICATNRDLESMVAEGAFREDLWFRINVITCKLPPLRERPEDIADLMASFAEAAAKENGFPGVSIEPSAIEAALAHAWPGNVRELLNRVQRAVALGANGTLTAADLFPDGVDAGRRQASGGDDIDGSLSDIREAAERRHIVAALAKTGGSTKDAADLLQVSRTTLWEKMRRYGIDG
ncbi:sigma-54-dependent Fis family transcriptional regulator [Aquibium carbonis]|uniref:Sigma-54-dependent Fis family transcriptional regulator n=1 Tax=Aquibium carbonis TaxID=2495581 RepID=A0A3S0G906_9HYPH|nr:sigma-54 dependent transcriptional regulator [Aquibium carbonis]RST86459.1 sigma-54-dependent Fis family transcriptional regulator [Aquibium carbonis]